MNSLLAISTSIAATPDGTRKPSSIAQETCFHCSIKRSNRFTTAAITAEGTTTTESILRTLNLNKRAC